MRCCCSPSPPGRGSLALAVAFSLSACAVGPNFLAPKAPPRAAGHYDAAVRPVFDQSESPSKWWRLYDDPVLDKLIAQAFAANTDLRVAVANLRRARAVLGEARAARLPTTDVSASAQYRQFGGLTGSGGATGLGSTTGGTGGTSGTTGGTGGSGTGSGGAFRSWVYSLGFDTNYEVDLFGRVTRLVQAARADADALEAVRDTTRITVAAETARAYADACSAARQLTVARGSIDVQARSFGLTERLYAAGRGTRLDTARAQAQLETTRSTLPGFVAARQGALYRLAVLTGEVPETIYADVAACTRAPLLMRPIPVGDGSALLRRRPDIREVERTLAAETARIGVATADLFPRISLGGSVSTSALKAGNLFGSSSISFGLGPALSWSFPNFSVARARIREAEASAEGALATFDGTVLAALRDTEVALANYAGETDRNTVLCSARDLNVEAVRIVRLRYRAGAESFLNVLDAERTLATAEAQLAASDAQLTTNQIAVFNALGGGWEDVADPVVPPQPYQLAKPKKG